MARPTIGEAVNVRFTATQLQYLTARAAAEGVSRAEVVRRAVEEFVRKGLDAK